MPYRFLEDVTWADTAFEVEAGTLEELFSDAAEALLAVLVADRSMLGKVGTRTLEFHASGSSLESSAADLLHGFLQRLLLLKDAEQLLAAVEQVKVAGPAGSSVLSVMIILAVFPFPVTPESLGVDVKAVTHHQFSVKKMGDLWGARVVLDV